MAINYTPAQSRAIYEQNKSILVSAAAGSGKTAVVVQRIIELICKEDGIDIDKLLVVTFTNAAAAEMKDKIYKEIMSRIEKEPTNPHLKRQLLLLSNAHIQTMHSFCLDVIKNNIHRLDIPVQFRIADETECSILQQKCLSELIEDSYEANDESFLMLADTYGYGRDDSKIADLILKCYHFTITLSDPQKYFDLCLRQSRQVEQDFSSTIFASLIIERIKETFSDHEKNYQFALEEMTLRPDLLPYEELFREELGFIQTVKNISDFCELQFRMETFQFAPLTTVKGVKRGTDNTMIKEIRQQFKDDFAKVLPLIANSVESEQKDAATVTEFIGTLIELTKDFTRRYQLAKLKKSLIDFSDFEHYALQILSDENGNPSETADSYREIFYEILIDEYQDTNDIQDHLFQLISRNGENLFLVGDVKQSIYGFRHAKPQIFIEKQETYQDETHEVILLSNNFRSRTEVVDAVNSVFIKTMTPQTGKTDYQKEALVQTAPYPNNEESDYSTEILLIDKAQKFEIPDEDAEDFNQEALLIANRIHKLVNEDKINVYDLKSQTLRKANYGDIVILVRSMKEFSRTLYETLTDYAIPVDADFSEDLFSAVEIKVLVSVLEAIDNPYNDLSLLSLLKSPLFHWTEDQIFTVRNLKIKEPFICSLQADPGEASRSVLYFLEEIKKIAYTKKISELIEILYSKYHWKDLFCVYKNPQQRMENLDLFYQLALQYDQNQTAGLKGFLNFLTNCMKSPKNIPAFRQRPPKNAVQIITMHKSKGLEYPIVFLAGLGRNFSRDDSKLPVVFHKEYGIAADYIDRKHRFSYPTLAKKALLVALKNEAFSEELRTLYVAMTRAKEKLILTGTLSNAEKKLSFWESVQTVSRITKNRLYHANSYLDYIMPSVLGEDAFHIEITSLEQLWNQCTKEETKASQDASALVEPKHLFVPYHHKELTQLPTKIAVTEANRMTKAEPSVTSFILSDLETMETTYSHSEYGTYFHQIFEHLDLDAIRHGVSAKKAIRDTVNLLGEREYSNEISEKIEAFFQTDLAQLMLSAEKIYREKSFLVRIPANIIYPVQTEKCILLQGITDCYFIKNNEITLLDFKTDRNPQEEKIRSNYTKQMELYGYALEKLEEKKVIHKYIYTAHDNRFLEF